MRFVGSKHGVEGECFAGEMNSDLVFSPLRGEVLPEYVLEGVDRVILFLVAQGDGVRVDLAGNPSQPEGGFPARGITRQAAVDRSAVVLTFVGFLSFLSFLGLRSFLSFLSFWRFGRPPGWF